jgi:peptidoglycan-associated lipoprotein
MIESERRHGWKIGATLLLLTLMLFTWSCKKKVPPPPPPPPVVNNPGPTNPTPTVQRPVINSFTIEPSTIDRGQSASLRWSVSNATDMSIDHGIGAVQSQGQRQVFPAATTTYVLTVNGPGGSDTRSATVTIASAPAPPPPPPTTGPKLTSTEMLQQQGGDAYFDYDRSDIRQDAQQALTGDATLLKQIFTQDPGFAVVVEGHCDERGSAEYNLALGDRRATAAKEFLVQLGVGADRLKTISYGKEKPQCTDANEACYQKNRRAHLSPGQ